MSIEYHYGKFPPKNIRLDALHGILLEARTELGRYDGLLSGIDNADVLLAPLFKQEAVLSSRIEGTQSSLSDVYEFEAEENNPKFSNENKEDINEIINYLLAIKTAIDAMETVPLSQKILKNSHRVLMMSVRGKNQDPGNYRRIKNWIGPAGQGVNSARYIPIRADAIPEAMSTWERFLHEENNVDVLLKAAILHAEFEALHPFLDGNGRLGRMLIPLYLWHEKIIQSPAFYISAYFERHRQQYYDLLLDVSKNDDWTTWCDFFLKGVIEEAKHNFRKTQAVLKLYKDLKNKLPEMTKSQYGIVILDYIFSTPVFSSSKFYQQTSIPRPTAQRLLRVLSDKDVLLTIKGAGRRSNMYLFKDLKDIVNG